MAQCLVLVERHLCQIIDRQSNGFLHPLHSQFKHFAKFQTFDPILPIHKFVRAPSEAQAALLPDPKRFRVLQIDLVDMSEPEFFNRLDLVMGQGWREHRGVVFLQNAQRHRDDNIVGCEFGAVGTLDDRARERVLDRAVVDAVHGFRVLDRTVWQLAKKRRQDADETEGN